MAQQGLLRDLPEVQGGECIEFPIVCATCLGPNPYVKMGKLNFHKQCNICQRPFTVFKWIPGRNARQKSTVICETCSKAQNACQVCILDLQYNLPIQARNAAVGIGSTNPTPMSDTNREFFAEEYDRKARLGLDYESSSYEKVQPNETLLKLQRHAPYYPRNLPKVCSFYAKGKCTRGDECPYRHEMPITGELGKQNIKDRYYGHNDPVALKILNRVGEMPALVPPEDESIRTLYVGGVDNTIAEHDLLGQFFLYGEIESVKMVAQCSCAFVTYVSREGAEKAAEELSNKLVVNGKRLKLSWGKSQIGNCNGGAERQPPQHNQYQPPQGVNYYPSMDAHRMGARY
ncbi:hypothetical protein ACHQM5_014479 [Ranunculus cassubicifolius]